MERPSPRRLIVAALSTLAVCGVAWGGYALTRYESRGMGSCPDDDVPVLAAGVEMTLSCAAPPDFSLKGVDYTIGCEEVHPSRVGPVIASDGGETEFDGARKIVGVPARAVVLVGDRPGLCHKKQLVAFGDRMTNAMFDRMSTARRQQS